jgi:uncharacterized membrane protein YhaH (DUF805 family)
MQPPMGFCQSIKSCMCSNYVNIKGRARRSEFWYFFLFILLLLFLVYLIGINIMPNSESGIIQNIGLMYGLTLLIFFITFIPFLALCVRRFHDIGKSGWFILLGLLPIIGQIVLIYFYCQDSVRETNKWGDSPKYSSNPGERKGLLDSEEIKI